MHRRRPEQALDARLLQKGFRVSPVTQVAEKREETRVGFNVIVLLLLMMAVLVAAVVLGGVIFQRLQRGFAEEL